MDAGHGLLSVLGGSVLALFQNDYAKEVFLGMDFVELRAACWTLRVAPSVRSKRWTHR